MPAATVKAVVFDLDGTAVTSGLEGRPTPQLKRVIKQAQAAGLHLSAATGRSWDVAERLLDELSLTEPCIIAGGTQIIEPRSRQIIWQATLPVESQAHITQVAARHNCHISYAQGLTVLLDQPATATKPSTTTNVMYILGVRLDESAAIIADLATDPNITVAPAGSWRLPGSGVDLHITSNVATKEHAVHELAAIIGVPASQMAGVGDGPNDLHLFNAVGYRVAMGNAVPELKAAADEVIGSVEEDGLAQYLTDLLRTPTSQDI